MEKTKSKKEEKKAIMKEGKGAMGKKRKFVAVESTKEMFIAYRFKVHFKSDRKVIDDLLKRGFQTCESVHENKEMEECFAYNTFEMYALSSENESDVETVLFHENIVECFQDPCSANAIMAYRDTCLVDAGEIFAVCNKLTENFDIYLRAIPLNIVLGLREIVKELNGHEEMDNSICEVHPVVAYILDEKNPISYFNKPGNKNKILSNFIDYARNKIIKEGKGRYEDITDMDLLMPRREIASALVSQGQRIADSA